MRQFLLLTGFLLTWGSYAQALRDINFNYLYNPAEHFRFNMQPVKKLTGWEIHFNLTPQDTSSANRYTIRWQIRESLTSSEGIQLDSANQAGSGLYSGTFRLNDALEPIVLLAEVTDNETHRSKVFFRVLKPDFPVDGYLADALTGEVNVNSFVHTDKRFTIGDEMRPMAVSFFNDDFPAASPAFSESMARVASKINADSLFIVAPEEQVVFSKRGLYLMQKDTAVALGFAVRAEDDYPKFNKLQSLYGPMIYITTKPEYERLKSAGKDKKVFDKVILGITRDSDRAKNFMRSYFRRVEMANLFFTSYKEGWKTDRGMIYIIFGMPEEVYMSDDQEMWRYDNDQRKLTFNFVRSATLFDPENYVLVRDKKYQRTWYEAVDLWRNARF